MGGGGRLRINVIYIIYLKHLNEVTTIYVDTFSALPVENTLLHSCS